jgi:2-methylcitrate dehydratase PrpD
VVERGHKARGYGQKQDRIMKKKNINRREFFDMSGRYGVVFGLLSGPQASAQTTGSASQATSAMPALANFVASLRYDDIPAKALETARTAIADCLGVAVAGAREESARISGAFIREEGAKGEAVVYGQRFKTSAVQAAFANGIAAHAHDFDHSFVVGGQPTSPIIPAVFSLGDALSANGKQILEAYVTGFEVVAALMFTVQNAGGTGWHANGTIGSFGASAACAKLLGLKEPEIRMALAITASMASGIQSNFGTMTKPLHVGQAARNGVLSARLAKAGFTANPQTLEVRNGFFDCYYPGGKTDRAPLENLGRVYALEKYGVRFKPYPCGGLTHTAIYATIELRNDRHITPDVIEHIDVEVPADTAAPLVYRVPKTGLEGKFSMPYLIARALIDGKILLETFTDEAVRDKDVLQLLDKVDMKVDPKLQAGSDGSRPANVTVKLKNGQTETLQQKFPKGSPQVPMAPEELLAKFRACSRGVLSETSTERAYRYIGELQAMATVRPLTRLLAGG